MSALLRNPALVPSLFARAVDEDAPASPRGRGWRGPLQAGPGPSVPAGVLAIGAGLLAALIDVPLVQAASHIAATALGG